MIIQAVSDASIAEEGRANVQKVAEDPMKPTLIVEQPDGYDVAVGVQKTSVIQISEGNCQDGRAVFDAKSAAGFDEVKLARSTA